MVPPASVKPYKPVVVWKLQVLCVYLYSIHHYYFLLLFIYLSHLYALFMESILVSSLQRLITFVYSPLLGRDILYLYFLSVCLSATQFCEDLSCCMAYRRYLKLCTILHCRCGYCQDRGTKKS